MRFVQPRVFLIGRTQVDKKAIRDWLNFIGADEYQIEDGVTGGEQLVQLAGKRCYMSFQVGLNPNIQRIRTDMADFIENILKVGHGSVIEHAVYNFAIENVSRVFTGEMNRHRAGVAISEGSMRFIRYNDIPIVEVPSICLSENESLEVERISREGYGLHDRRENIALKKHWTRDIIQKTVENIEKAYGALQNTWSDELSPDSKFHGKKQITSMLRRIIPMGVATGGVWSLNFRALRHVFTMRCSPAAEEEILLVASMMLEKMMEAEPEFFKDFHKDEEGFWKPKYFKV